MALNVTGLVNNIRGSLDNLVDQFAGRTPGLRLYPESTIFKEVQNVINVENWSKLNFPYTFSVIDILNGQPALGFKDFQLPLAPQSISQSEEFATSIKPTQGGTVVTHSGNKYKTLTIAGTTGIAPFRGTGGVDSKTGQAIFQPNELKYHSGYEVFLMLRNYFKTYYEAKRGGFGFSEEAARARLVFKNFKDGEFLIIELTNFTMERQAAKPHLYDYKIDCKVLGQYTFQKPGSSGFLADLEDTFNTVVSKIDLARGTFLRTQGILRQVESTYNDAVLEPLRKIGLAVKAFQGIPLLAGDISKRTIKNTMNAANSIAFLTGLKDQQKAGKTNPAGIDATISSTKLPADIQAAVANQGADIVANLGPVLMVLPVTAFPSSVTSALADDIADAQNTTKTFIMDTISELERIKDNCEDKFNLGSEEYDELFDRTATLSAEFGKVTTEDELDILDGFNQAISALNTLLVTDALFKSDFQTQIDSLVADFNNNIELQALPSVRQYTLASGETLERIAQRELGDANRWPEIIEINDLKYPFITDDIFSTTPNVAKPGDIILLPDVIRNGFSDAPKGKEINAIKDLNEVQRSLGVDLKVTPDFDLALGNNDDLQIVAGTDNMAQAVFLKLVYEKGDVLSAPEIGVGLSVGSKIRSLSDIKDAVVSSLLQDPRIENITDLAINRQGSTVALTFNLHIKRVDIPVPVRIRL